MSGPRVPEGIEPGHIDGPARRRANPLPILILAAILALALLGLFGGGRSPMPAVETADARLAVQMPAVIRNGQFFESRIFVTARRPVGKLVVAVSPSLWRDLTQNSMVPQASEEAFRNGRFEFDYGPLGKGEMLEIKIDFQINPALFGRVAGEVTVLDDTVPIARLPLEMKVRP